MSTSSLLLINDVYQFVVMAVPIVYSPFARTWRRALVTPFIVTSVLAVFRVMTMNVPEFGDVPALGFVVMPFVSTAIAAVLRGIVRGLRHLFSKQSFSGSKHGG